jgi:hypothetical protein
VLGVALSAAVMGCGQGSCAVSGRVLLDGQPVADGRIALRPTLKTPGVRTVQAVIANGDFVFVQSQGIVPGNYSVVITARRKTGQLLPPEEGSGEVVDRYEQYLPAQYNTDTKLRCEIVGDTDDLLFELELPRARSK